MLELATKNDRSAVNRLARQVHEMHVQWRPDLYQMPEELFPEELYSELLKNRELYVAKLDGAVIGFALLKMRVSEGVGKVTRKIMLVDQLCVDGVLRNHGIGTQIGGRDLHHGRCDIGILFDRQVKQRDGTNGNHRHSQRNGEDGSGDEEAFHRRLSGVGLRSDTRPFA